MRDAVWFMSACMLAFGGGADVRAQDMVISEIMFNPDGDENAREYVELLNRSTAPRSLEGYLVGDGQAFDRILIAGQNGWWIPPGGYALILDPDYFTTTDLYAIPQDTPLFKVEGAAIGNRGLSNSVAETVSLISSAGDTVSQVTYDLSCPPGHSWERILPDGGDDPSNFAASVPVNGTPGHENSVLPPAVDPALDAMSLICTADPVYGGPAAFSLSWRNRGRESASAVRVEIVPPNGLDRISLSFPDPVLPGGRSEPHSFTIEHFPGGLNVLTAVIVGGNATTTANDTLRFTLKVPVPDGTVILDEVMAAPKKGEPEWVELFNTGKYPVSLAEYRISDADGNRSDPLTTGAFIGNGGFAIVSGGAFASGISPDVPVLAVSTLPSLNNDGDTLRLLDWNGAPADSMEYGQAENGVSFELISPGLRGSGNGWDLCVDPSGGTPGRVNSIHFPPTGIDAENIPDAPLLSISPNPFEEHTEITYRLPFPLARVRLFVYDRSGRLVATLRDVEESGAEWTGVWDGCGNDGRLPAGPYILNLEALDKQTGKVHTERSVVVIGSRL